MSKLNVKLEDLNSNQIIQLLVEKGIIRANPDTEEIEIVCNCPPVAAPPVVEGLLRHKKVTITAEQWQQAASSPIALGVAQNGKKLQVIAANATLLWDNDNGVVFSNANLYVKNASIANSTYQSHLRIEQFANQRGNSENGVTTPLSCIAKPMVTTLLGSNLVEGDDLVICSDTDSINQGNSPIEVNVWYVVS